MEPTPSPSPSHLHVVSSPVSQHRRGFAEHSIEEKVKERKSKSDGDETMRESGKRKESADISSHEKTKWERREGFLSEVSAEMGRE